MVKLCVHPSYWSRSINLETLGINSRAHVFAPVNSSSHPTPRPEVVGEDVLRFETSSPIAPGKAEAVGKKRGVSSL